MSEEVNETWAGVTRGVVVMERSSSHLVKDTRAVTRDILCSTEFPGRRLGKESASWIRPWDTYNCHTGVYEWKSDRVDMGKSRMPNSRSKR